MLKNFQVIEVISSKTKAQLTFYTNKLKFNPFTAQDLGYAPYVQFLMDSNGKCFAVRACEKDEDNAIPFSRPQNTKAYPLFIKNKAIIDAIANAMNWHDDTAYYVIPGQRFPDERAIVFNLKDADQFAVAPRNEQNDGEEGADGNDTESV